MSLEYIPRLKTKYNKEVVPYLSSSLSISNPMRIPRLVKVVLNIGMGDARDNSNQLKSAVEELSLISGQKPVVTKSKKAISNFKLRINDPVGVSVTLRKARMYEFLDRFISAASPRIRDFRGIPSKSFDGRGNYSLGINEQVIFPEIDYAQIDKIRSFQVTVVTSANSDSEALRLLQLMGFPFIQNQNRQN